MAIGPVQLIVLGFEHPEFHGEIIAELERLQGERHGARHRRAGGAQGRRRRDRGRASQQPLQGRGDRARQQGRRADRARDRGRGGHVVGAEAGAEAAADGVSVFSDEEAWDVIEEIPNDSAAALMLIEHHWAVPLRDAIVRAGGFRISDGFISPLDLVEIGLVSARRRSELHAHRDRSQAA